MVMLTMDRKATIVLLVSSIGFLVTALLLLNHNIRLETGKMHLELLGTAAEGEQLLFFLDKSAEYALEGAVADVKDFCIENERGCENKLKERFEQHFSSYVNLANAEYGAEFGVEDYELDYEYNPASITFSVAGRSKISIQRDDIVYSVVHDFGVSGDSI